MRFDGKTVVVTGGALGIGQAVCEIMAERGASVAILDWDEKAGNETCKKSNSQAVTPFLNRLMLPNLKVSITPLKERGMLSAESIRLLSVREFSGMEQRFRRRKNSGARFWM